MLVAVGLLCVATQGLERKVEITVHGGLELLKKIGKIWIVDLISWPLPTFHPSMSGNRDMGQGYGIKENPIL